MSSNNSRNPVFHIHIKHMPRGVKLPSDAYQHASYYAEMKEMTNTYQFDLSRIQLEEMLKLYSKGKSFLCGGKVIEPFDVSEIQVYKASLPSSHYTDDPIWQFAIIKDNARLVTRDFEITLPSTVSMGEMKVEEIQTKHVFIVHGRNHTPMKELKLMLKEFGLDPIVLHEQPSGSRTIIEKLEKYSDVGYAFVILTPDDRGGTHKGKVPILGGHTLENSYFRARQNVILELGYFIGLLGRDKVCCLYKGDIDLPSDIHGIVYIPFKESVNEVRDKIVKELKAAGYKKKV